VRGGRLENETPIPLRPLVDIESVSCELREGFGPRIELDTRSSHSVLAWAEDRTKEMTMTSASESSHPRIVVGVDGSASSIAALNWAAHQAELTDLCKIAQDRGRDLHWARPKPIPGELVRRIRKRVLRAGPIQAMGNFKRLFCVYCQAFGDNHDRLSHFTRNIENGLIQKLPEFGQGVGGGTQGRELVRFCPPSDRLICRHEVDLQCDVCPSPAPALGRLLCSTQ
jgi:hypothetical protein